MLRGIKNMKYNAELYGMRFGNGSITEALANKEFGVRLDITSDTQRLEFILSTEEAKQLIVDIQKAIDSQQKIM